MITATGAVPRKTVIEATGLLNAAQAVLQHEETERLSEEAKRNGGDGAIILSAFPASIAEQRAHREDVRANGGEALLRLT